MRRFWHGLPRIDDHGLNWIRDSIVICILDSLSLNQPMHYALVSFRNKSTHIFCDNCSRSSLLALGSSPIQWCFFLFLERIDMGWVEERQKKVWLYLNPRNAQIMGFNIKSIHVIVHTERGQGPCLLVLFSSPGRLRTSPHPHLKSKA